MISQSKFNRKGIKTRNYFLTKVTCIPTFLLLLSQIVYGQIDHTHLHDPDQNHDVEYNHRPTHLQVDYSFRSDAGQYTQPEPDENGYYWWKGNLHTHTLWSDGDQFRGDELYVRVSVVSSKLKENYNIEGEYEKAWLQPVLPGKIMGR